MSSRKTGAPRRRDRRPFRSRRMSRLPGSEGRWTLIDVGAGAPSATERRTALVEQLLRRYGVLVRAAVGRELVDGGFSALYPVLKAMEEAGRARRGYFVAGMGGAQFAVPGADDLLRSEIAGRPTPGESSETLVLAASDPANAYGALLPWPDGAQPDFPLQRGAGARVFLDQGILIGYLGRGGRRLATFPGDDPADGPWRDERLARALGRAADRGETLLIEQIDGSAAGISPLAPVLRRCGFVDTSRGLLRRAKSAAADLRDPDLLDDDDLGEANDA